MTRDSWPPPDKLRQKRRLHELSTFYNRRLQAEHNITAVPKLRTLRQVGAKHSGA